MCWFDFEIRFLKELNGSFLDTPKRHWKMIPSGEYHEAPDLIKEIYDKYFDQTYHIHLYLVNSVDFDSRFEFAFPGNPFLLTMCVLLNYHE